MPFKVLFWGVREIKKIQFTTVDHPRIEVECGGKTVTSTKIANMSQNINFENNLTYLDVVSLNIVK